MLNFPSFLIGTSREVFFKDSATRYYNTDHKSAVNLKCFICRRFLTFKYIAKFCSIIVNVSLWEDQTLKIDRRNAEVYYKSRSTHILHTHIELEQK